MDCGGAVLVRFLPAAEPTRRASIVAGYGLTVAVFGALGIVALVAWLVSGCLVQTAQPLKISQQPLRELDHIFANHSYP